MSDRRTAVKEADAISDLSERVQLAAQVLDLVAQLRRVLEAKPSAATYISSSSVTTSFSSSSRVIPSTSVRPRRRRVGTLGDSSASSSAMSETPLTIVSGVIPCSAL